MEVKPTLTLRTGFQYNWEPYTVTSENFPVVEWIQTDGDHIKQTESAKGNGCIAIPLTYAQYDGYDANRVWCLNNHRRMVIGVPRYFVWVAR